MRWRWVLLAFGVFSPLALAQTWQTARAPGFVVETASPEDARHLPEVFRVLQKARRDLIAAGYPPPPAVRVVVHPHLKSYTAATRLPWFILAAASRNRKQIDSQRLRLLLERGALEHTLRHELFHLAQPAGWPRWKAEGMALRFAGDRPRARPLENIGEAELERLLASPPDPATLSRAMATAFWWVGRWQAGQNLRQRP
ncbi:MAG: hypothetical protein KatS3mg070_2915 [Meiothermus sp.]|uniref:hypothetical protein n=1 Tax=Meiothermus sp. TaxID=1955249 RepID=UPI0021DDA289|nr:hypothetical protein [Meiothermus sp.]GIW29552.1 MAG: hypothetical protein KatS3mg070_2915 [Meiothermus sp.]